MHHYDTIPDYPETTTGTTVFTRLIDGLIFRYYWATEGLTENELQFRPSPSGMKTIELLDHIHQLAFVTHYTLHNQRMEKRVPLTDFEDIRKATLALFASSRTQLETMDDTMLSNSKIQPHHQQATFPFWHLLNGPVADALTHVGQINSWRRIAGNPTPAHNPFLGKKIV